MWDSVVPIGAADNGLFAIDVIAAERCLFLDTPKDVLNHFGADLRGVAEKSRETTRPADSGIDLAVNPDEAVAPPAHSSTASRAEHSSRRST